MVLPKNPLLLAGTALSRTHCTLRSLKQAHDAWCDAFRYRILQTNFQLRQFDVFPTPIIFYGVDCSVSPITTSSHRMIKQILMLEHQKPCKSSFHRNGLASLPISCEQRFNLRNRYINLPKNLKSSCRGHINCPQDDTYQLQLYVSSI